MQRGFSPHPQLTPEVHPTQLSPAQQEHQRPALPQSQPSAPSLPLSSASSPLFVQLPSRTPILPAGSSALGGASFKQTSLQQPSLPQPHNRQLLVQPSSLPAALPSGAFLQSLPHLQHPHLQQPLVPQRLQTQNVSALSVANNPAPPEASLASRAHLFPQAPHQTAHFPTPLVHQQILTKQNPPPAAQFGGKAATAQQQQPTFSPSSQHSPHPLPSQHHPSHQLLLRRQQQSAAVAVSSVAAGGEWRPSALPSPGLGLATSLPEASLPSRGSPAAPQKQKQTQSVSSAKPFVKGVVTTDASRVAQTSVNSRSGRHPRQLLESLSFPRVLFVSESFTPNRYNVSSSMLRKNYENFILLKHKQALVTPGPKKAKDFPRGVVIAYGSGFIVSVATRPHFVGLGIPPNSGSSVAAAPGGQPPPGSQQIYADWLRRKFRSHELEPSCATNGKTRFLAFLTRADLPQKQLALQQAPQQLLEQRQIFLEELHDFLLLHLPHWTVVYDPEVAPFMVVCRRNASLSPRQAAAASAAALSNALHRLEEETAAAASNAAQQASTASAGLESSSSTATRGPFASASEEAASAASSASRVCEAAALGFRDVSKRLLLPLSSQPVHLWPSPAKVLTYCRKEAALTAAVAAAVETQTRHQQQEQQQSAFLPPSFNLPAFRADAELRVSLLLGAGHVVGVSRGCSVSGRLSAWLGGEGADFVLETREAQAATSSAIADIWGLLRYFVGSAAERFAPPS